MDELVVYLRPADLALLAELNPGGDLAGFAAELLADGLERLESERGKRVAEGWEAQAADE